MRNLAYGATAFAAAVVLSFWSVPAAAVTIVTFDGGSLVHGSVVSTLSGITFNVTNQGGGPSLGVAFDTEQASDPNDGDLLRVGTGPGANPGAWATGSLAPNTVLDKALIIQENATGCGTGVCSNPDDEAGGGVIEMVLASSVFSVGLDVIDIDTNEASGGLTFWDGGTSVVLSWSSLIQPSDLGNNSANRIAPISILSPALAAAGFTGIDRVEVRFIHSGAIDNVTVPEPGGAELLGLGAAALLLSRWRPRSRGTAREGGGPRVTKRRNGSQRSAACSLPAT